jgi:hypothetical protein
MKPTRAVLIAAAVTVVVVYGIAQLISWPSWLVVLVSVILLVGLGLWRGPAANDSSVSAIQVGMESDAPSGTPTSPLAAEPVPSQSRKISGIRLPSASSDYQFEFEATVCWSERSAIGRHADPGSIAVDAVLTKARSLSAFQAPTDETWAAARLAALLGEPGTDENGQIQAWATHVRLALPSEDRQYLLSLTQISRREQATRLERRLELETRAYLKDDVFATIGSAASWWLARNPDQVEKCVGLLGDLRQLSNAANDRMSIDEELESISGQRPPEYDGPVNFPSVDSPPSEPPPVFDFDGAVAKLLEGHDDSERSLMADSLATLEARFNRHDRAQRIRELHDVEPIGPSPKSAIQGPAHIAGSATSPTDQTDSGQSALQRIESDPIAPERTEPDPAAPESTEVAPPVISAPELADSRSPGAAGDVFEEDKQTSAPDEPLAADYREKFFSD